MVSNVCLVDQAAQAFNIYLIIYVWVSRYGSQCQRIYIEFTKNPQFHTFFEILGILLKIPSTSNSSISKFLLPNSYNFDRKLRFSMEILGFLFKILGISKICDNHIPHMRIRQFRGQNLPKRKVNTILMYLLAHFIV